MTFSNMENGEFGEGGQLLNSLSIGLEILINQGVAPDVASSTHYFQYSNGERGSEVFASPRENGLSEEDSTSLKFTLDNGGRLLIMINCNEGIFSSVRFCENGIIAFRPSIRGGYELWQDGDQLKRSWAGHEIGPVTDIDYRFWGEVVEPIKALVEEKVRGE